MDWYAVRCVLRGEPESRLFEERITIWQADTSETAIQRAETEIRDYAATVGLRYLGLAQAYQLPEGPGDGAEVFSLLRESDLADDAYLNAFFDTGTERQRLV